MNKKSFYLVIACIVGLVIAGAGVALHFNKNARLTSVSNNTVGNTVINNQAKNSEKNTSIILYFSDKEFGNLIPEKREVSKESILKNPEETIINELIKGPINQMLLPTIPKGTKLLSLTKTDNTVTVNFSKEFVENHPGGSAAETLTIYSIVNSLTELKDVEKIQFLIEGKKREEYKGHYQFDIPFTRNEGLIKKE